jgi:hypothetical protein
MNDKVQTSQSVYTDEQVEILDNGAHLGWADVVEGKWVFTSATLAVKKYELTARYSGVESAPWVITVAGQHHFDDFSGAPLGGITTLQRPHFLCTVTETPTGGPYHPAAKVEKFPPSYFPLSGRGVRLQSTHSSHNDLKSVVCRFDFVDTYSTVSLDCVVVGGYHTHSVASVQAFRDSTSIETVVLPVNGALKVSLGTSGVAQITAVEIILLAPANLGSAQAVSVDNLVMTM